VSTGGNDTNDPGNYIADGFTFKRPTVATPPAQPAQADALASLNASVDGMKANVNSMVQAEMEKMKNTINEMMAAAGQSTNAGFP
jgi:hypothetical protein